MKIKWVEKCVNALNGKPNLNCENESIHVWECKEWPDTLYDSVRKGNRSDTSYISDYLKRLKVFISYNDFIQALTAVHENSELQNISTPPIYFKDPKLSLYN